MMIPLGNNIFAEVDDADFGLVWMLSFTALKGEYTTYANGGSGYLHRIIMKAKQGEEVDHIDGNGLNCCRSNLRIATSSQNKQNRNATNKYKGVRWRDDKQKFIAQIRHLRVTIYLGYFDDEIEAAKAYDRKAVTLFGAFAKLNFPEVKDGERPV